MTARRHPLDLVDVLATARTHAAAGAAANRLHPAVVAQLGVHRLGKLFLPASLGGHDLSLPEACEVPGWRLPVLPASYVNFLIVNGGVLVPTFRQHRNDDRALGMIRELFPGREVVGIDCLDLVEEGGTLHCISQQQPA